ncbi:polysaccharide biosynthesis protein [Caballeronia sp. Lep1P3]|uniref:polysaccharide biosynthesis protein n=1 Tax=Caballeronia sp. Lep1P3 TaxID=2878150 RepID=UPI001FD45BCF|nr:polysaccharide biosynthesis protein [Caballeronia sp. Lep1P3]
MLLRFSLRVLALAAKFGLTIVIARTLGLEAVAHYGLAVAASVIASKLFGLGFSAELNRRMSGPQCHAAIATARALRGVYAAFYLGAAAVCLAAAWADDGWLRETARIGSWAMILFVAASEHYAFEANTYVFSVHRSRAGSAMLFVRTGGWAIVAISGLACGMPGGIDAVFLLWALANAAVIVWAWSQLRQVAPRDGSSASEARRAVSRLRETWIAGAPYYVGGVVLAGLQYAERFVASAFLPANEVGRYVFAWSVANAVQTICYATVGVVAAPRLARAATASIAEWRSSFRPLLVRTLAVSGAVALGVMASSPLIFRMAKETATAAGTMTLGILVVSFLLRSLGDLLWAAAVARAARGKIVIAVFLAAACAFPASLWLIRGHGAMFVAIAHLLASALALAALAWARSRRSERAFSRA